MCRSKDVSTLIGYTDVITRTTFHLRGEIDAELKARNISPPNRKPSAAGSGYRTESLQYGYQNFLEQVNLAEQLTSAHFGISTGLFNQNY